MYPTIKFPILRELLSTKISLTYVLPWSIESNTIYVIDPIQSSMPIHKCITFNPIIQIIVWEKN